MKDKVLTILKSEFNALTTEEISSRLNLNVEEIKKVQEILNEMVQNFEL